MGGNCVSNCTFQIRDFILCKKSLMGYNLIGLGLQVKFKNGLSKFFPKLHIYLVYKQWDGVCYWCVQVGV